MDFAKAFSYVFDDSNWVQKIVIGGLLSIIPIFGQLIVLGYMVSISRNVINGNPHPLPEWSDFGQFLVDGLYVFVISLVYVLPILIVMCVILLPALAIGGAFSENGDAGAIGAVGTCCFTIFAVIYGAALGWLLLPAAIAHYADKGDFMAALRFTEILSITRANPISFLMAFVVTLVAGFVAGFGVILCFVGVWFTSFYAQCVTGHAYAQAYVVAKERAT